MYLKNIKNGTIYQLDSVGTNCTNKQDGQKMVRYHSVKKPDQEYYRKVTEFFEKFVPVDYKEDKGLSLCSSCTHNSTCSVNEGHVKTCRLYEKGEENA